MKRHFDVLFGLLVNLREPREQHLCFNTTEAVTVKTQWVCELLRGLTLSSVHMTKPRVDPP